MSYPNRRGGAKRSKDRNTRYATHIAVLNECVSLLNASEENPMHIIEHGMGLASTPFFHSLPRVEKITSFEREPEWSTCANCMSGSTTPPHQIIMLKDDTAIEQTRVGITRPSMTLVLVDGYASQRAGVVEAMMSAGCAYIVEHDAETFRGRDIEFRKNSARVHGYSAHQYMGHDPETAFFVKNTGGVGAPTFTDQFSRFVVRF